MMSMMYQAYQNHMDLTAPWRSGAAQALKYLNLVPQGVSDKLFGRLAAALELISRTSLTYTRPPYGIDKVLVGNQELEVTEEPRRGFETTGKIKFTTQDHRILRALKIAVDDENRRSREADQPGISRSISEVVPDRRPRFRGQLSPK